MDLPLENTGLYFHMALGTIRFNSEYLKHVKRIFEANTYKIFFSIPKFNDKYYECGGPLFLMNLFHPHLRNM